MVEVGSSSATRVWLAFLATLLTVAVVTLTAEPTAVAQVRLVPPASGLRPLRVAHTSLRSARADVTTGLPRQLAAIVSRASLQTSAAAGPRLALRADAFVLGSPRVAARVLAAWRRTRHATPVRLGAGGFVSVHAGRRSVAAVAWREGARIGVVVLSAQLSVAAARAKALGYAVLADSWLRSPLPTTAWDAVLDEIQPNGTVSRATALQAFAVAYGRLPGVRAPAGRRAVITSGTLAAEWILSHWHALTGAERRVVSRLLGLRQVGRAARAASYGDPGFQPEPGLQAVANQFVLAYQGLLKRTLSLKVVAGETTTEVPPVNGSVVLADALPLNAQGGFGSGTPVTCRVRVTSDGQKQTSQFLRLMIAHEVFHCFQFDIHGGWTLPAAWITEGMADWAALTVDPVPYSVGGKNLTKYIDTPHTSLFQRDYDAVGFWGHVDDVFPSLWTSIATILNAGSNESSFALAGGSSDAFLTTWGSSVFRADGFGAPWEMHSPIAPPAFGALHGAVQSLDTSVMPFIPVDAPPLTTSQYTITSSAADPLLHVTITGHARLGLSTNYTKLENAWFCVGGAPCVCPKNTEGQVPPTMPLAGAAALALSGDPDTGTHGELQSLPLSAFCQPKPSPRHGGIGASNGDPYIGTFDGGAYGFQTAGEFTLVKSTTDDLEIQSRQVPYPTTLLAPIARSLAMNTAFAMRDGGAIVEVDKGSPLVLYINHRRRSARGGQTIRLAGDGRVRYSPAHVIVRWSDGTRADVFSIGDEGVNIAVMPSPRRAGLLRGLLGADDDNVDDDFIGRNGERYNAKKIQSVGLLVNSAAQVRIVLGGFGRSWRITQRESLFVYPPGKNTRSYLVKGFPRAIVSLFSLPHRRLLAAQTACRRAHVTNATLLVGCEIDYGATGDRRLATSTGTLQRGAGIPATKPTSGISPIPWTQLSAHLDTNSPFLLPSIAHAPGAADTIVSAFQRYAHGSIESDTFHAGTSGIGRPSRQTPITGWSSPGNPVLFAAPGGGLQMIFSGVRTDLNHPPYGTLILRRAADGSYGKPVLANSTVIDNLGGVTGAVLASDRSTPLWADSQDQKLAVYRGAVNAVANDLTPEAPGLSYNPALAYDHSGRLWIAWYMTRKGSGSSGLYMMQLDPATGAAKGPALHVPSSDGANQLEEGRPALACEQTCRVVYNDGGKPDDLLSWAPGDAKPTLVFSGAERIAGTIPSSPIYPHSPTAAYTSDGRLWVVWRDTVTYLKMYAKLGNATGAAGTVVTLQVPAKNATPEYISSLAIGSSLVVVGNWSPGNAGPTSVWGTVVNPG